MPELPQTYYHDNFLCLINTVNDMYGDLLSRHEKQWYDSFIALSKAAQCLYIRLLTRKGPYFRYDKIHYPEIESLSTAFIELEQAKMISLAPKDIGYDAFCTLYSKPELIQFFDFLSTHKQAKKGEIVAQVINHHPDISTHSTRLIEVYHNHHLSVFFLLFFGNSHQDLSQFVLTDLGLQLFEDYPIDPNYRLFHQRLHIDQWLQLSALNEQYWRYKEAKDLAAIAELSEALPDRFDWPPLERKRQQLINHIGRDTERLGSKDPEKLEHARLLYQHSERPPSRERQIRILDKQGGTEQALALALQMQDSPTNEEEADVAGILTHRLLNKLGSKQPPRKRPKFDSEILLLAQQHASVELDVSAYYQQRGWQAYFLENTLLCGLFGLAMWDIIFSAQQGAFLNPFQRSPKDMFSHKFYLHRQPQIDERLAALESGDWQYWLEIYRAKQGISNDWVNWGTLTEAIIHQAATTIPVTALVAIFKRILFDPKNNRNGFPDLILFKDGQYCFAEVKGPGDTLQNNQIRWLKMFQQHQISAKVVYVKWV
ncbi:VRR-NUC domain-containing protein [Photobacterium lutimaris]|uniref:VRR-NUC domain-containing protein n=1 Tax=Photobacterium lutimaris TaxID=388278 RepID=UPI001414D880|nr:VRR-NUC domain-containing protein [Photobacterium lutimaris]